MVPHIQKHEQEGFAGALGSSPFERDHAVKRFLSEDVAIRGELGMSSKGTDTYTAK